MQLYFYIMILSPVTNEPVNLWILLHRCYWSVPQLCQSFVAPVPTCCWHQIQKKHMFTKRINLMR